MKAYKCPSCGELDPIRYSNQGFYCFKENCDWAFKIHDGSETVEVIEIIDWQKELIG